MDHPVATAPGSDKQKTGPTGVLSSPFESYVTKHELTLPHSSPSFGVQNNQCPTLTAFSCRRCYSISGSKSRHSLLNVRLAGKVLTSLRRPRDAGQSFFSAMDVKYRACEYYEAALIDT